MKLTYKRSIVNQQLASFASIY